jgi:glycosyltransferase involved in cell wall biosynthesis
MSSVIEKLRARAKLGLDKPKRVLLLTQASGAGVGRHFFDLAEGLAARGVEAVGIYSPRKLDTACRARLASGRLPEMHAFPMRRAIHPMDAADLWRLGQLIRKLGPFDIIHGHSSKGGALARLAARRLDVPSVYTPNAFVTLDQALPRWQRAFYGRLERWMAWHTGAIIAVSHDEAEHARLLGIDPSKVFVIPNGVQRPDFPPRDQVRAKLGIGDHEFVVGYIGRLAGQKAPDVMLDAYAAAFGQNPGVRLVMVGSGPLEADVRRHIERLQLTSRVLLLGDVVGTDIMPAFDTFCLSSRFEGLPYVIVEALACGLPIVSTRVGGVSMCIEPDGNGLIVPPDDAAALAAALTAVAGDAERRRRFAVRSEQLAPSFTAHQMVDKTLEVYQQVLAADKVR